MIGDLIKQFEEMETNTVADFNKVFVDSMLCHPLHHEVEIGPPFNGVRELTINGKKIYHDLTPLKLVGLDSIVGIGNCKKIQLFYADGTLQGEYNRVTESYTALKITRNTFYRYLKQGRLIMKESA